MLDKRSGRIAYAILSFGGFFGVGRRYRPLPWPALKYDTRLQGYVVGSPAAALRDAPSIAANEQPAWGDRSYEQSIHDHYGTRPYWASTV
jgi:hypothetical protein